MHVAIPECIFYNEIIGRKPEREKENKRERMKKMNREEIKARARAQLGGGIFQNAWMMGLVVCLLIGLLETTATSVLPVVGGILVLGPLEYGMAYIFLKQARDGQPVQMGDMFRGFQDDFGGTLLIGLMTGLFTFLWSLLFCIPGIVKAYSYSMVYYIKVDHPDYDWKMCIDESRRMMNGHKWEKFVLDLSFIGWILVGSLCLGVGTLWVTPYMTAAEANFYESIRDGYVAG